VNVVELEVTAVASVVLTLFAITKVVVAIRGRPKKKKARANGGLGEIAETVTAG
jgi:hypothetical protein